jgi:hypothetical protein
MFLKQSTDTQNIMLGPFLDATDGATAETMTLANTDIKISKAGANFVNKNSGGGANKTNGFKLITLDATDTATVGELTISCKMSGALAVFKQCWVLEEAIYDAIYAPSATLAGSVADILTDTGTTLDGKLDTIDNFLDTEIAAIKAVTDAISTNGSGLSAVPWNAAWDAEVQSECRDALNAYDPPTKAEMDAMWTTAMVESYADDNVDATPAQILYMILCAVSEFSISGTTITGKEINGTSTAMTWTLDDASNPTSRTRAT